MPYLLKTKYIEARHDIILCFSQSIISFKLLRMLLCVYMYHSTEITTNLCWTFINCIHTNDKQMSDIQWGIFLSHSYWSGWNKKHLERSDTEKHILYLHSFCDWWWFSVSIKNNYKKHPYLFKNKLFFCRFCRSEEVEKGECTQHFHFFFFLLFIYFIFF